MIQAPLERVKLSGRSPLVEPPREHYETVRMPCRLPVAAGALVTLLCAGRVMAQAEGSGAVPSGPTTAVVRPAPAEELKDPELVEFVEAEYPKEALEQGIQGTVVLKLTITKEGRVKEAEVMTPAGHGFDEAAREAALKFVYKPATRDGKPFAVKIPYAYRFTIQEVEKPATWCLLQHHAIIGTAGKDEPILRF